MKLLSLNIANLLSKLSSLKILIDNIFNESNMPSIIALTETHLSDSRRQGFSVNELMNLIPGYKFYHEDRKTRRGGGIGIFVSEELNRDAVIEKDIDFFSEEVFESITLKIPKLTIKGVNKDLIVLTVYRQPGHEKLREFLELLEKWLEKYDKGSNEKIITGDLNLDLLKFETHHLT